MTKSLLLLTLFIFLSACSNDSGYEADISNPKINQSTIDLNKRYIESYQDLIKKYEEDIEKYDNDTITQMNKDEIDKLNRQIENAENNIEIAEHTYVYNEEFMTVGNHALIIDKSESILTEGSTPDLFSNDVLKKIRYYDSNDLIDEAVIASLVVPLQGDDATEVVALSVYLTRETLNNIDFDELLESNKNIFDYAEGVHAHGSLEEYIKTNNSGLSDEQHQVFYMLMDGVGE